MAINTVKLNDEVLYVVPVARKGGVQHLALGRKRQGRIGGFDPNWVITPRPEQEFQKRLEKLLYQEQQAEEAHAEWLAAAQENELWKQLNAEAAEFDKWEKAYEDKYMSCDRRY